MKTLQKFVVITEGGRVVGTQAVTSQAGQHPGVKAVLGAGPGQHRHEIEVEMPATFASPDDIQAFHDLVAGRLGLTKKPQSRK
jgi:hypothetical protein